MELKKFVDEVVKASRENIKYINVDIKRLKDEIKDCRALIKDPNKDTHDLYAHIKFNEDRIEKLRREKSRNREHIAHAKKLLKLKLVRLKTGAVIPSIHLEHIGKRLEGCWIVEYSQYKDGIEMKYKNTQTKIEGSVKLLTVKGVPEKVELPLFEEGEVVDECLAL